MSDYVVNKEFVVKKTYAFTEEDLENILKAYLDLQGEIHFNWSSGQCVYLTIRTTEVKSA